MHVSKDDALNYGKLGLRFALKAFFITVILCISGLVLGGFGGAWLIDRYVDTTWIITVGAFISVILGGVIGFFLSQVIIAGIIEDALLSAGIKAGKVGLVSALKLIKEKKENKKPEQGV